HQARDCKRMADIAAFARRFPRERASPRGTEKIETKDRSRAERNRGAPDWTAIERSGAFRAVRQNRARSRWLHREHTGSGQFISLIPAQQRRVHPDALPD